MSEDTATSARIEELERRLATEIEIRERLVDVAGQLNSTFRLDELLELVLSAATDLLEAEAGSLMLADEDSGDLTIEVTSGSSGVDLADRTIPAGQGIAGWAIEHRQPAIVDEPANDPRFYGDVDASTGFTTNDLLVVPMFVRDRPVGVIELINKLGDDPFSESDLGLATAFAGLAAIALDNAALYARLTDAVVTARMSYRIG